MGPIVPVEEDSPGGAFDLVDKTAANSQSTPDTGNLISKPRVQSPPFFLSGRRLGGIDKKASSLHRVHAIWDVATLAAESNSLIKTPSIASPISSSDSLWGMVSAIPHPKEDRQLAVAVFCGAKTGRNTAFVQAARLLASALHDHHWSLVYGGGTVGLMGEVAHSLVSLSGPSAVQGFIPEALLTVERARNPAIYPSESDIKVRDFSYGNLTVVKDMHVRKALMCKAADAFVALPGGFGTMEELMEIITWNFLGIHDKPVVIFNVDGYYDEILRWVHKAVKEEFVDRGNEGIVVEATTAQEVIEQIKHYRGGTNRQRLDWGAQEGKPMVLDG